MTSRRKAAFQCLNCVTFVHCSQLKHVGFITSLYRITFPGFEIREVRLRFFLVKMVPKSSCSSKWLLLASKHEVSPMKTQRYTRSFFPPFNWHRFFTARSNLSAHVESGKIGYEFNVIRFLMVLFLCVICVSNTPSMIRNINLMMERKLLVTRRLLLKIRTGVVCFFQLPR